MSTNTPFTAFRQLVKANEDQGINHRRRLWAIYLKMLPAAMMSKLENWRYSRRLSSFSLTQPPLYLLGHWRSGTTFLQFLLGKDPQIIYHSKFQTFFPRSFLLTEETVKPVAEAFLNSFSSINAWRDGISLDMGLDTPSEIEVSLMNEGSPVSFHWGHIFPKSWKYYFDRYLFQDDLASREYRSWKRTVKRLNRKVQLKHPDKRLMVKNPGDTARINAILDLYPEAKFVFIHRNPYDVYYSNKKLWRNILNHIALQSMPAEEMTKAIRYTYRQMHQAYLEQRSLIPKDNLLEISHEDLASDPLSTVAAIYDQLGLPGFSQARPHLEAFAKKREGPYEPPPYTYDPGEISAINEEWSFAFDAFGYARKSLSAQN